jgi:UDP-2,4-diacetamido-2,4,6-trideoxy-beta-L-altropyranose hydrolase
MSGHKVGFRVDASFFIGSGHVMRCLALAKALADSGATCTFFSRAHQGNLNYLIEKSGFNVIALRQGYDVPLPKSGSTVHAAWLGVTLADELLEMQNVLKDNPIDVMIVDHYALDAEWERSVREFCPLIKTLAVIDDLADRQHYADLLVDQNVVKYGIIAWYQICDFT